MAELWTVGLSIPKLAAAQAERAEAAGWDGIVYVDSQNLAGDTYVALAMAAKATQRLQVGTGVTNPCTRHPAVTASAIATVQAESDGRAVLGIGRGDSSLAYIGLAPAPVRVFERYLAQVQAYLRGEQVPFDELPRDGLAPIERLRLANAPTSSRLEWLRMVQAKVPVDVAATGPRVIRVAARHADRVTFAVGADADRMRWAIETARAVTPDVPVGAFVNVVAHDDVVVARSLVSGGAASFARFSSMHGHVASPVTDEDRAVMERVHDTYDMTRHTRVGADQTKALDDAFIDRFAVVGSAATCVDRLRALVELGLERLVVVGPTAGADRAEAVAAQARFVEEVMPALRA
jgi:5,10-methylenetetrahydromethanopterin reductase